MIINQLRIEFKRSFTVKNILKWLSILLCIPLLSFIPVSTGYYYYYPVDVFQEIVGLFLPLIFPVLIVFIYLPDFLQEQKNHFVIYTRSRIPLSYYILAKGVINAILTGFIVLFMLLFTYIFVLYIEPNLLRVVNYSPLFEKNYGSSVTFFQFAEYGNWVYVLVYSLWVAFNAVVYGTIAFLLMLIIKNPFVALSAPFLFYHIFNFVAGVFGGAKFSPLSTVFPFNVQQQELWTVLVPLLFLLLVLITLYFIVVRNKEEWVI